MSVNFNRTKYNKAKDRKGYKILLYDDLYPLYWDEGIKFYPNWKPRFEDNWKRRKQVYSYQIRMYKTWKHNRKTQWK